MADDKTLTENDDDLEIVEVDDIPSGAPPPKKAAADTDEDDDSSSSDKDEPEDDEDDGEDSRLADDADEEDDDDPKKKRRIKRRQIQKAAKERTLRELAELRQFKAAAEMRFAALEGNVTSSNAAQIDQRLAEVQRDIRQTDLIIAKAIEAGNGTDAAEALRLRDEAKKVELELERAKVAITTRQPPQGPQVDPRVVNYAAQWKQANPWYDSAGGDDDSAVVNAIDNRLSAEGYDPRDKEYWEELSRRVSARLHPEERKPAARDKRKPPPQGSAREHAPQSTRREVYVTPERKAAMIEAGVWDDPSERAKMLKAYEKYDRENRSAG